MGLYQGRALRSERPRRRRGGPVGRVVRMLLLLVVAAVLVQLPWGRLRRQLGIVREIRVEGTHYLDADRVAALAGVRRGADLWALDLTRARQALLLNSRIAGAEVGRAGLGAVRIRIREREPAVLVQHGTPWEVDSAGVLMAPLATGQVADVPLLAGPRLDGLRPGAQIRTPAVLRGLAWERALERPELQLGGQVSQIAVADPEATEILLMSGTRVLCPAWPPGVRELSALRVVLGDLAHRGVVAERVDMRFQNQVIVTPTRPVAVTRPPESRSG